MYFFCFFWFDNIDIGKASLHIYFFCCNWYVVIILFCFYDFIFFWVLPIWSDEAQCVTFFTLLYLFSIPTALEGEKEQKHCCIKGSTLWHIIAIRFNLECRIKSLDQLRTKKILEFQGMFWEIFQILLRKRLAIKKRKRRTLRK